MNTLDKAGILLHIARWRLTWKRRDIDFKDGSLKNTKFISARDAAGLIKDGAVVFSSGMAANTRCSIFFWAIQDRFRREQAPRDLTWIVVGAQGGRGIMPGTIEELGTPGLIRRFIAGHLETTKAQLRLGDNGEIELHAFPQGVETFLLEAQARDETHFDSDTGVGTFLDPRVGGGTYVGGRAMSENFVEIAGERLRYHFPPIDYSIFVAPYADAEGNIYKRNACMVTESLESSLAAKRNGGIVIASVSGIVPKDEKSIFLSADKVDYIVVNPRSEQTGSIQQRRYWPMFTVEHRVNTHEAVEKLKFACNVLSITPVRTPAELAVARMAASLFTRVVAKGALVNIGVGLGEEVCRLVYEGGLHEDVTFFTETGVLGGLPAPGIFFGAAINPKKILTSAQIFHLLNEKLEAAVFGFLEVDGEGNVNVSRRGPRCLDYVGPGGLPDLANAAKTIIFAGSWMAHGRFEIDGGRMRIAQAGTHKFMPKVSEITFSGRQALAKGKNVFYATNVGLMKLTERGMTLIEVMPGIDIRKDILESCPMKIVLPESGEVPTTPREIVTGEGFCLKF